MFSLAAFEIVLKLMLLSELIKFLPTTPPSMGISVYVSACVYVSVCV